MTRIRSTVPRTASQQQAGLGPSQPLNGPAVLSVELPKFVQHTVEIPAIGIHRGYGFTLGDFYPAVSSAEHRALVQWERRRADLTADLPDDGGFSDSDGW